MLSKLQSSRSFEVLNSTNYGIAIKEIESKFWDWMANRPTAARCHESVAKPWKRALEKGVAPELVLNGENRRGADYYFVKIDDQVFPMRVRKRDWNPTEITLFEPVRARDFSAKKVDDEGMGALYNRDLDKVDSITASREWAPTTHVRFKDGDTIHNEPFAWAMWETTSAAIRRVMAAEAAKAGPAKRFDPVLEQDVPVARPERYGKVARELLASIGKQGLKASAGPPAAHDLLDAFSYNGRPIAVTSQRPLEVNGKKTQPSIKIWIMERQPNGTMVWVDLPPPKDGKLPAHGATTVLDGSTLRIFGGVDQDGDPVKTHFAYDLGAALRDRHRREHWRMETPLDEAVGWPAALSGDRELYVAGGVAGYYMRAADDRTKLLTHRRDLRALGRNGWKRRDPFPADLTGASTAFGKGCAFIGPGNQMSGRVFVYDTSEEGLSLELPKLPKDLGLGQLFLEGSRLLYSGGFEKNGAPSKAIYELDLEDIQPSWKKLGDSNYGQGAARVVDCYGSAMALMIAPGKSAAFHLSQGAA